MGSPSSASEDEAEEGSPAPAADAAAPGAVAGEAAATVEHSEDDASLVETTTLASQAAAAEAEAARAASDGSAQEASAVDSGESEDPSPEAATDFGEPPPDAAPTAAAAAAIVEEASAAAAAAGAAEGAEAPDPAAEAVSAAAPGSAPEAAAAEATAGAAAEEEGYEDLFGSGDEAQSEASLDSNADLFGDDVSPAAAAASAAAALAAAREATAEDELAEEGLSFSAAAAKAPLSGGEEEDEGAGHEALKEPADSLPPQDLRLKAPWLFRLQEGASVFTWKVPPAIALITTTDAKQQQEQQQQRFAIKFSYDEEAAAQGKPAYSSNCRLVQYSDDSYCLFVDDHGFECNIKEDVSYIFESGGAKEPLCSVFSTDRRLQVLIRAGVGADSFFYNSKKAERLQHKTQTALTTTELVEAAELAQKQAFLTRQEAARSRRAQAESQRGLTRGFLEAEDSDQEDGQGESLEKIKERFKRRRFL
ncbi:hypothetical protein Emag_002748 [Eimeria magna]